MDTGTWGCAFAKDLRDGLRHWQAIGDTLGAFEHPDPHAGRVHMAAAPTDGREATDRPVIFRPAAEILQESPPVAVVRAMAWHGCVTVLVSESGNADATFYLELTDENLELGVAALTLTALKVRDEARPAPLRLLRTTVTLLTVDADGRPHRTCRIELDSRSRQEVADDQARATKQAEADLDQRAYDLIAKGEITSVGTLRVLLGVGADGAQGPMARLLMAGRVGRPARQRTPYTVVGDGSH